MWSPSCVSLTVVCYVLSMGVQVEAFAIISQNQNSNRSKQHSIIQEQSTKRKNNTRCYLSSPLSDDDVQNQLARARKILEAAKAKAAARKSAQEDGNNTANNPKSDNDSDELEIQKRKQIIKSKNEDTGLITTDGELMAAISEEEEWEVRDLMDVFKSESTRGRHDVLEDNLANRDVAASIFNLRMQMKDDDYRTIFNKRNRFIGEDN